MEAYLAHIEVERGLSSHTVAAYRRDLDRFAGFAAQRGLAEPSAVDRGAVEDFVAALARGDGGTALAPTSVARALAAVRSFYAFALAEGALATDPTAGVAPPRAAQRLPKALAYEQVATLLAAAGAGDGPLGLRDAALLELLYGTGARISELVSLDIDDLPEREWAEPLGPEADGAVIDALLLRGKGGKERIVPFGSHARSALDAYLVRGRPELSRRGAACPAVFLNARGARLSRQSAFGVLRRAAERAEVEAAVSPHTLRHSFATHMLAGGADVRVVQELLGHSSVTTTQIYTLVTPQRLLDEYATSHPRARARPK